MKKIYFYSMLFAAAAAVSACSDDKGKGNEPGGGDAKPGDVEVTIATSNIETKAAKLEFTANDAMNVFAKKYSDATSDDIASGIKATYDGTKWTMTPKVYINANGQKNAFLYAVSPYDASITSIKQVPVDVNKQVDVLYSGSSVPASVTTNSVRLNMKHALALASFNIVPVNYNGTGTLTSLKISGEGVYGKAILDGTNGKFSSQEAGDISATFNRNVENGGWKSNVPGLWVIPFTTKGASVILEAVIDGKTYTVEVPEVEMKQAYQFIFRLALTNNGLEFDPSKTETISLNQTTDEAQTFAGFGRLTIGVSGTGLVAPSFFGDNVFGTITTPAGSITFKPLIELNASAGQSVVVESWNSTGVEFSTLTGIDEIDFTEFE